MVRSHPSRPPRRARWATPCHRVGAGGRACRRPAGGAGRGRAGREVRDRRFVSMEPGSSSRTHLVDACARAGVVPRIAVEANDLFLVESMVGAGLGPAGMNDQPHLRLRDADPGSASRTVSWPIPAAGCARAC
ncbi:LysR substrate-binding domain-containing protein [Amycolatopsis sp. NPDC051903]|uniref:LysR substrate-binding domain-containing protein n=1 Tax=Amycolatopsis sp. NPDC051903 TaxID=3363936 RepID=UPI00379E6629